MDSHTQTENYSLRRRLEGLLHEARLNEVKMRRFDTLERQLIGATSILELIRLLLSEYKQAFSVEFVTLTLVDRDYEITRIIESTTEAGAAFADLTLTQSRAALESMYFDHIDPYLAAFDPPRHASLFNAPAGTIASVALLPLRRHGELIGSLNFGSTEPDRYAMLAADASSGDDCHLSENLLAAADRALYQAKHKGRNRVETSRSESAESARPTPASARWQLPAWPDKLRNDLQAVAFGIQRWLRRA